MALDRSPEYCGTEFQIWLQINKMNILISIHEKPLNNMASTYLPKFFLLLNQLTYFLNPGDPVSNLIKIYEDKYSD